MKLYLAVNNTKVHVQTVKNQNPKSLLFSYHYFNDVLLWEELAEGWYPENLIVDSGAFSVWTKQGSIDINKYISYCRQVREAVDDYNEGKDGGLHPYPFKQPIKPTKAYFVNLDVLPGNFGVYPTKEQREYSAEEGWKNMEYMENQGVKVLHVFHQHEDFSWLKKLADHQEYFGLSPANDESQSSKNRWLAHCFSMLKASRKTHGFAVTSVPTLLKFPFYSADSSSWVQGAKYAAIPTFKDGKMTAVKYKEPGSITTLMDRASGKKVAMLDNYHERMAEGVRAYINAGEYITKVWEERGIKWED